MATLIRSPFVDDLIPLILDISDHWWTEDYLRLAYVSSPWLYYVRKRLYACPSISSFTASQALAETLQGNPELLRLVSGIELQPMATRQPGNVVTGAQAASMHYLLGLEGLKKVRLGGQMARQAERFLNSLAFPDHVEELVVDGGMLGEGPGFSPSLEWDESMLYRFTNLQTLRLANVELDIIAPSAPAAPRQLPINHLILDNVDILDGFLCQMVGGAVVNSLSICAKSPCEYDEQVRLVLDNCDVQALQYEVSSALRAEQSFLAGEPGQLPLRRLRLEGHSMDIGMLSEIAQRCTGLQELIIGGRSVAITPQEWEGFITTRPLTALERIGLPGGSHLPPFVKWTPADFIALQSASESQRLQLI
ncbi:hypothetical protein D9611_003361 [Ephemerocybe angulata]|uniref:Uncharacterized protein n=1 Tax=Ephemerocybe angulata TaxID=980116 RepID=A0A8H5C8M8_9AGAR|nr:hypothetical protein D9611_003361 [Tulosesus angulatus]